MTVTQNTAKLITQILQDHPYTWQLTCC